MQPTSFNHLLFSGSFIHNEWATSRKQMLVFNPFNQQCIQQLYIATQQQIESAIQQATVAFQLYQQTTTAQRSKYLKAWHRLILNETAALATLLTTEQGKPFTEAVAEIQYAASFIEWYAEECKRSYGKTIPSPVETKKLFTIKQPLGVVGVITPWNFPAAMLTRKLAPALAAGCTVIAKPAEETPLTALALAHLAKQAGFPAGVLNVIIANNPQQVGKIFCNHPSIQKISFTGSTSVGKKLMQQSASTLKKLSLELGGNAPCLVLNDANIQVAVKGVLASKYRNAGQTCVCANRIIVQKKIYKSFIKAYVKAIKLLNTGNGLEKNIQIGPLINNKAKTKMEYLLKDALQKGAITVLNNNKPNTQLLCIEPIVISNCNTTMLLFKEEIFAPISAIYIVDTVDEMIALANQTAYGLAAYCFTENNSMVFKLIDKLQAGMVAVNEGILSHTEAPFGGINKSGFGKEGGAEGLDEYLITKYACVGIH